MCVRYIHPDEKTAFFPTGFVTLSVTEKHARVTIFILFREEIIFERLQS